MPTSLAYKSGAKLKAIDASTLVLLASALLAAGLAELVLRVKSSDMRNCDVEMWRY
jgi:hypothetical protein